MLCAPPPPPPDDAAASGDAGRLPPELLLLLMIVLLLLAFFTYAFLRFLGANFGDLHPCRGGAAPSKLKRVGSGPGAEIVKGGTLPRGLAHQKQQGRASQS